MRRKLFSLLISLLLVMLPSLYTVAQTEDISLSLTAPQTDITVGDPFTITLTVQHPVGVEISLPPLDRWGALRVRSQSPLETTTPGDDSAISQQSLIVSHFRPGPYDTPPLTVTVRQTDGQTMTLLAPPISLTIQSVLTEGTSELRDIRPQANLPQPFRVPPVVWPMLGVVLFTALLGWWLYLQQSKSQPEEEVEPRPAHEIAEAELDRIEQLDLLAQGAFRHYYILLSDCLRTYLENRYVIPAMDSTTTEIKQALRQSPLTPELTIQIGKLLSEFDLGKFAELQPPLNQARESLAQVRQLVEQTKIDEPTEVQLS